MDFGRVCCADVVERGNLRQVALGFSLTLYLFFPRVAYDLLWLGVPEAAQREWNFRRCYRIEFVEIDVDGTLTPVVVTSDVGFWASVAFWALSPAGSCPDGCDQVAWA